MPRIVRVANSIAALLLTVAAACSRKGSSAGAVAGASGSAAPAAATATPAGAPVALAITARPGEVVHLVDANGRAVYFLESPTGAAEVHCTGDCATAFDPVTGKAVVVTGDTGVKVALIGQAPGPNGTTQVTYAGKPLYYYRGDTASGTTAGHGKKTTGATARLVSPEGKPVSGRAGR